MTTNIKAKAAMATTALPRAISHEVTAPRVQLVDRNQSMSHCNDPSCAAITRRIQVVLTARAPSSPAA